MNRLHTYYKKLLSRLAKKEEGVTIAEYALLLTLIAVACIATITTFSGDIQAALTSAGNAIKGS